ncbi:hypothetical protein BGZ76_006313 [Entomortierella beljakovae]|nr:hypothetical protein BGZ76_006313 [Entomortierella beljakovae]
MDVLNKSGVSVSHGSILNGLRGLTKGSIDSVKAFVLESPWLLVYDNLNIYKNKHDQRRDNHNQMENGTMATIIKMEEGIPKQTSTPYALPSLEDFLLDENNREHFQMVSQFYLLDVLSWNHKDELDQATTEGNLMVIETVMKDMLKLPSDWFEDWDVIIASDQLTTSRVRYVKALRDSDLTRYS